MERFQPDGTPDPKWPVLRFKEHPDPDAGLQFGRLNQIVRQPDGKILVAGHFAAVNDMLRSGLVRILPRGSVDPDFRIGEGFDGIVRGVCVQPDGAIVAVGAFDLVDGVTRNAAARLLSDGSLDEAFQPVFTGLFPGSELTAVAMQGDKILVSGQFTGLDGHEASRGKASVKEGRHAAPSVLFPDGRRLIGARTRGVFGINTLVEFDLKTGKESPSIQARDVQAIAVSPDGSRIATIGGDGVARLWDATSRQELFSQALPTQRDLHFPFIVFSPEGGLMALGGKGGVTLWRTQNGLVVTPPRLQRESGDVRAAAFSPDGTRIVLGADPDASIWDLLRDHRLMLLTGHTRYVPTVAFSPDGTRVVSGSDDGTLRLWHSSTGRELMTVRAHPRGVVRVAFSPDGGRWVSASASEDATVSIWMTATPEQVALWTNDEVEARR